MFFKLTPEKVVDRINKLIDELGVYDVRIKQHEDDAALAIRCGIARPGDHDEIREWRAAYNDIYETLADARYGIKSGQMDFAVIDKMLPSVRSATRNFKRVLDETDKLKAAGRAAARDYFRNPNAQN